MRSLFWSTVQSWESWRYTHFNIKTSTCVCRLCTFPELITMWPNQWAHNIKQHNKAGYHRKDFDIEIHTGVGIVGLYVIVNCAWACTCICLYIGVYLISYMLSAFFKSDICTFLNDSGHFYCTYSLEKKILLSIVVSKENQICHFSNINNWLTLIKSYSYTVLQIVNVYFNYIYLTNFSEGPVGGTVATNEGQWNMFTYCLFFFFFFWKMALLPRSKYIKLLRPSVSQV